MPNVFPLELPDDLLESLRQEAEQAGTTANQFAVTSIIESIRRRQAGRAEGQRLLHGPARPFEEVVEETRRKYGIPDLSHLTPEERSSRAEAALEGLSPERRAELKRLGLV